LLTTTATGGMLFGICLPPNQREVPLHYDYDPTIAGQHHAPSAIGEQSRGCKTSSFQWKDGRGKCIC